MPLTADEVCSALYEAHGDVTEASLRLKVGSLILRKFVERSSRARAVIHEMNMRLADRAKSKLREALEDEDHRRQDWAIRYILNSQVARPLGLSSTADAADPQNAALRGPLLQLNLAPVQWADGTPVGPRELAKNVIELAPNSSPPASKASSE
jgi:hypothetical protein